MITNYDAMVRYFIELAYNGTGYHGWQIQLNGISVQQELENALTTILRKKITVTGAGRTDAGVHAKYMVAHFDIDEELEDPMKLAAQLSGFLPFGIVVYTVKRVDKNAHARFDAVARRYEYHITLIKDPFAQKLVTRIHHHLNFDLMNRAAAVLVETADFTSFSKLHSGAKTNICKVYSAVWTQKDNRWIFTIEANRFLRDMVRAIVGTLLDVGRGKISFQEFVTIVESKDRKKAGRSVPPEGLYLIDIVYPEEIFTKYKML